MALGRGPTPVRRLGALLEERERPAVWLKDDGVYGRLWGGNKARKLEWTLADALRRGTRTIVTVGAMATNHGLATALYARELGIGTVLLLVDQPADEYVDSQLRRLARSGATLYRTRGKYRTIAAAPWLFARHADLRAAKLPHYIPVGGSSPLGCVGYVDAGLELGEQVERGELPEPSHVVVALGSGGTAAGLMLGLKLAGLRSRVVAVVVNDKMRLDARVIARRARRTLRLLRRRDPEVPDVDLSEGDLRVEGGWLGGGYGHRTPEAERARRLALERVGLELEPVYTAKAMAALLDLAAAGSLGDGAVVYWHTHDAQRARVQ